MTKYKDLYYTITTRAGWHQWHIREKDGTELQGCTNPFDDKEACRRDCKDAIDEYLEDEKRMCPGTLLPSKLDI